MGTTPLGAPNRFDIWRTLTAVILYLAFYVVAAIVVVVFIVQHGRAVRFPLGFQMIAEHGLAAALMLVLLPWVARVPLRELGLRRMRPYELGIACGAAVLWTCALGAFLAYDAIARRIDTWWLDPGYAQNGASPLETVALYVGFVVAAISTELFGRVLVFGAFRRYLPLAPAVLASALIEAHPTAGHPFDLRDVAFGALLALTYATSRNAYASMLVRGWSGAIMLTGALVTARHVNR